VFNPDQVAILQQIKEPFLAEKGISLYVKREDLIHPLISGNKWRKLKYNIQEAKNQGFKQLLTFGGAYSNHIYATAAAAKESGLKSIGIIRGEETLPLNSTLQFATDNGMSLHYLSRSEYRAKQESRLIDSLKKQFGECYHIPEGGSNALAVKGCAEISTTISIAYDVICSPVGTGGTLAGLVTSRDHHVRILGFSALKGVGFLEQAVNKLTNDQFNSSQWSIDYRYHFGGYAKIKPELIAFMHSFHQAQQIVLDPIYTGKMMYGLYDMIRNGEFEQGTTIVALHTGGLQGISGMEERYGITLPK
jgi:1-aminocyclopropane-1-carboxylate deaminase/D-cysteine desulfhydrase-like pyridoxal-dependent ACC family enzyme